MMKNHLELNLIARQYNERKRYFDYDRIIKELQCHQINSYDVPVYSCKFAPTKRDNVLSITYENGSVCIENIEVKNSKTYVKTHDNSVYDLAWVPGEKQFVTVSGDNTARLWTCAESDVKMISEFKGHSQSVRCVYFKPYDSAVFATGSRDCSLILWDTRSCKKSAQIPDQIIPCVAGTSTFVPKKKSSSREASVTGLVFQDDNTLISSGSTDKCIKVWDMRKTYSRSKAITPVPKHQLFTPNGEFTHICIDPFGTKLYANCMDSYIYCFNLNSYDPDPISAFCGHESKSFYLKSSISYDGLYLMSGSKDNLAYIWNTKNAELSEFAVKPLVVLPGHTAEVVCTAMTESGNMKIATCSDDGTYRIWCPYKLKKHSDEAKKRDVACIPDSNSLANLRFQWRNKRKLDISKESDPIPSKIHDNSHSEICQVCNGISSVSCFCRQGNERCRSDDILQIKRRRAMELQERTPPRSDNLRNVQTTPTSEEISNRRTGKLTSKRKLADMANFVEEENKAKKIGVLTPILENKLEGPELGLLREPEENSIPGFSSPTANLPNYVMDGSSPHLHRCRRSHQKENVDWLTKLVKEKRKTPQSVTPESKKFKQASVTPTSSERVPASRKLTPVSSKKSAKRRLTKQSSKRDTLCKYFKNKQSEGNLISQEMSRKDVETEA